MLSECLKLEFDCTNNHQGWTLNKYKLIKETDELNSKISQFVWIGDNLLALEKDGVAFNYIADGNKNITQLINLSDGNIANKYDYSPFGKLTKDVEVVVNPFKFSSEHHEQESGLIYYNYRYYNPENGKWLKRDLIQEQGGENLYSFIQNQPINTWDNLGFSYEITTHTNCAGYALGNGDSLQPSSNESIKTMAKTKGWSLYCWSISYEL